MGEDLSLVEALPKGQNQLHRDVIGTDECRPRRNRSREFASLS
jgi:hypothetical protein